MKNNVIYNNASGLYLVVGSGFISDTACNATKFTALEAQSQVKCAQSLGLDVSAEEVKIEKSFAVNYIRQEDINVMGQVNPNAKNPSKRRFATRAEARQDSNLNYIEGTDTIPEPANMTTGGTGGEDNTPVWTKGPNGEDVMSQPRTKNSPVISPFSKAAARVKEIEAQGEVTAGKGLLPEGTEFSTTDNGFGIATLPDGTMKNLGRVPKEKEAKKSFFAAFLDGAAPAKPAAPSGAAVIDSQAAYDKLPSGATYTDAQGNVRKKK